MGKWILFFEEHTEQSSQAFPHLSTLKSLHSTEFFKCSLFTYILFSRGTSSQVAGGDGGTTEVGPAKGDL